MSSIQIEQADERVELRAMREAADFYAREGWAVKNVARLGGEHAGYDLYLERGTERKMVEVKGCTRPYGIPDPYHTEFDELRRLIADELCVVYFLPSITKPLFAIIPRDELHPDFVTPKLGYRISGKFKNERMMKRFFRERQ